MGLSALNIARSALGLTLAKCSQIAKRCTETAITIRPDIAALGALSLPDHTGNMKTLSDLWAKRHAVFVFLRHYG